MSALINTNTNSQRNNNSKGFQLNYRNILPACSSCTSLNTGALWDSYTENHLCSHQVMEQLNIYSGSLSKTLETFWIGFHETVIKLKVELEFLFSRVWSKVLYLNPLTTTSADYLLQHIPSAHGLSWLINGRLSGHELHIPVIWPAGAVGMSMQSNKHRVTETSELDCQFEELEIQIKACFTYDHTYMVTLGCGSSIELLTLSSL